ncbi:hypothetical protein ACS0PU_010789 [Formica fusca]
MIERKKKRKEEKKDSNRTFPVVPGGSALVTYSPAPSPFNRIYAARGWITLLVEDSLGPRMSSCSWK